MKTVLTMTAVMVVIVAVRRSTFIHDLRDCGCCLLLRLLQT